MKKVFVILLLLAYGVSSPGATLYVHYCCGKVDKVDFNSSEKNNCPFSNNISKKGCCDNKQIELKIKSDYKAQTQAKTLFKDITAYISSVHADFNAPLLISNNSLHFSGVSPPLSALVPLYILKCVYRI